MNIIDRFFKKDEKKIDIMRETVTDIEKRALYEMHLMRTSFEEEASKIMEWCRFSDKKSDSADYVDVAVVLMSYSPEAGFAIFQEIKKLAGQKAKSLEENIFAALGKIDILYDENDHIRSLKPKRAEIYYLFGKISSYRIKKSAQILAVAMMSSDSVDEAKYFYAKRINFSEEVLRQFEEELKKYNEKIVKEIKGE